ncbi:mucin-22-like [Strongylocentrotus purpuratus]|uniref:Uncharacterized protein n=1 Tax=Strongylocentrotus purpuratus TaxID=7668 RepID=A0A7M7N9B3_STRPU|nr:mucin-22-like [Strongylocentrotus purpuratus]|eukprot:XP_011668314.1 PREDICTED: mucin-22-like [Strongylocentrotus purpuratus]
MGFVLHCILALFNLHVVLYAHGNACSETFVVCERETDDIDCGDGAINICTAVYGRTNPSTCVEASKTDCILDVSSEPDLASCNGQQQCTVYASNSLFGDPCPGTVKYLEITYSCQGDTTSQEETTTATTSQEETTTATTSQEETTTATTSQEETTTQPSTPQEETTTQPSTPQPQQTTTQLSTTLQQQTTIRTTEKKQVPTTTLSTTTPQTTRVQTPTTLPSGPIKQSITYRLLANNAALSASYSSNRVTSFIMCSQMCLGDASCRSFTYIGETGVCLLGQGLTVEVHQGAKSYTS